MFVATISKEIFFFLFSRKIYNDDVESMFYLPQIIVYNMYVTCTRYIPNRNDMYVELYSEDRLGWGAPGFPTSKLSISF